MRWLGGMLVVLATLAAAVVAIAFVLPPGLEVSETRTIGRPRATLYALVSDLRAMRDILPVRLRDPGATFAFDGPERGVGQSLRWTSALADMPSGGMRILEAEAALTAEPMEGQPPPEPFARVRYAIEVWGSPPAEAMVVIEPVGAGPAATVTWTLRGACPGGWQGLVCRYASLVSHAAALAGTREALDALAALAMSLPAADFDGLQTRRESLPERDFVFVEREAADAAGIEPETLVEALGALRGAVVGAGLVADGPARVVPAPAQAGAPAAARIGYPFTGPSPIASLGARVAPAPAGPHVVTRFTGPRTELDAVIAQFEAYMAAHRLAPRGPLWLAYPETDGDPAVELWRGYAERE